MRESITLDRIANSIILRKDKYENFILVEGTLDRLFFLKYKAENTQIELAFGWENLTILMEKLKERDYYKTIGIIDKDLRNIVPIELEFNEDIIETDSHDINILTIDKTFEIIFQSNYSPEKTEKFKENNDIACVKMHTYDMVEKVFYLRLLNHRENLHLSFKSKENIKNKLDFSKFINKDNYQFISLEKMIETITNFSRGKTSEKIINNDIILDKLVNLMETEKYDNKICINGHDFSEAICIGLKKALGSRDVEPESFLKDCILAYDGEDFVKTEMYAKIKKLEYKKHSKFLRV